MNKTTYLLKNATIVDGNNTSPFIASLLIKGDKINKIILEENTSFVKRDITIDCSNKIITPGFIDAHSHSDLQILRSPSMKSKIQQGITTEIGGNCGIGTFPLNDKDLDNISSIHELTKDVLGSFDYNYSDFNSFCKISNKNKPNTNVLFLQSHAALRVKTINPNPNREASDDEIKEMCLLLEKSLKEGCIGFSTGLYYAPCLYASDKELISLLEVVKRYDKIFCAHHRCEGDSVISSLKEIISLSQKVGVRTQISHLKAIGVKNQKHVDKMLSLIDEAKENGLDIAFDQYPYEYGSTSLYSLLPPSYLKLDRYYLKQALLNKEEREKIKKIIMKKEGWDSIIKMCGFDNISIIYLESQREKEGKTIRELAKQLKGKADDDSCFDTLFDILGEETGVALMEDVTQSIESIEKILTHPLMCFGTDAIYSGDEKSSLPTHPRSYQAAVHSIDVYYKQRKTLSLESLIYKMSGMSAKRFNIKNRGVIKKGNFADLVVMDIDSLKDNSNLKDNKTPPEGIEYVFVNGVCVYKNKKIINYHAGGIIKG